MATHEEVKAYVEKLQTEIDHEWTSQWSLNRPPPKLEIQFGRKFARIVKEGSAHHFVEIETGNILKAASWAAPAKGVRGHIDTFTYGKEVGLYGAVYWR